MASRLEHVAILLLAFVSCLTSQTTIVPQKLVETFRCGDAAQIQTANGLTLQFDEGCDLTIQGSSAAGIPWSIDVGTVAYEQRLWEADLNGDGIPEPILHLVEGCNGACCDFRLFLFLAMDDRGLPVPWLLNTIHNEYKPDEPNLDLIRWGEDDSVIALDTACYMYEYRYKDGSPDLWKLRPAETPYGWEASYRLNGGFWQRLTADEQQRLEAIHWDKANREDRPVGHRPEYKGPFLPDGGNDIRDAPIHKLVEIRSKPVEPCPLGDVPRYSDFEDEDEYKRLRRRWSETCGYTLRLDDGRTCQRPGRVVIDRPDGRFASVRYWYPNNELLEEALDGNYAIQLAGQLQEDLCSPNILWATHPDLK